MGYVKAVLVLLQELLRWRCLSLELQTKTVILDKVKELEKENEQFTEKLADLHRDGKHADADRLLYERAQYASFRRGILDLAKRADVYGIDGLHVGGPDGGTGEGPVHTEPNQINRTDGN